MSSGEKSLARVSKLCVQASGKVDQDAVYVAVTTVFHLLFLFVVYV